MLPAYHDTDKRELLKLAGLAVAIGLAIPLLSELLSKFVIDPIFCNNPGSVQVCLNGGMVAYYISAVLLSIVSVAILANIGVYRPVLIAFGTLLSLWGLKGFLLSTMSSSMFEYLLVSVVLYVFCYILFYWLMRFHSFGLALFLATTATITIRWVLLV